MASVPVPTPSPLGTVAEPSASVASGYEPPTLVEIGKLVDLTATGTNIDPT